jgi:hypothetical protein
LEFDPLVGMNCLVVVGTSWLGVGTPFLLLSGGSMMEDREFFVDFICD